jgi:starch-binding outer membrane protein, SusD/RagB family
MTTINERMETCSMRTVNASVPRFAWLRRAALATMVVSLQVGCDSLTDVEAPDVVKPEQLANAQGAEALTNAALASLYQPYVGFVYNAGLLSDEFTFATPLTQFADIDYRTQSLTFTEYGPILMHRTRTMATLAIESRRQYVPTPTARIGQLFAYKGYVEMLLGETSCNGTPLSEVVNFQPIYGGPMSSDSMLRRAAATLDSAVLLAADSPRILNLARVARGRALLGLGMFPQAAAVVAGVPTSYVYNAELTTVVANQSNTVWQNNNLGTISVADREGVNGLDYQSAMDPRVPTTFLRLGTDGLTPVYVFAKYSGLSSPIPMASGVEARLIQAEAALQANPDDANPAGTGWLGILNDLRATAVTPELPPLADPGTFNARVDLLFRERAFWLFASGHRMGDMRRLLRQYGRSQATLYPIGPYKGGVSYGQDIVFILTLSEQSNPNGRTCTNTDP